MLNRPIPRSSKLGILGLIIIVVIGTIPLLLMCPRESNTQKQSRGYSEPNEPNTITIVPELRVGDYTLGMSKDEVLKRLGEPKLISWEGESYTLNNLPRSYVMHFSGISFEIADDSVNGINVNSPLYKFANGLGVGGSEEKIKQTFGDDFRLKDVGGIKVFLTYEDKGLRFEIHKKNRTVMRITVIKKISRGYSEPNEPNEPNTITIVPGLRVGDYALGMSKDEVLKKLGEPKVINYSGEHFRLNDLPTRYFIHFGDISFYIVDDSVNSIIVYSPLYKFANGLGVGDSEEKIKQAFGNNFHLKEVAGKAFLTYEDEGLHFDIHQKNRTVMEITVTKKISRGYSEPNEPNEPNTITIVPGLRVGDYTLGMSKDEVLKRLGKPKGILFEGEKYTLNNLPRTYFMIFDNVSFSIHDDSIIRIGVHSPFYKFTNGLGVGDSEEKIKQAFGNNFHLKEVAGKAFLTYEDEGLHFDIHQKNRTVMEINVSQITNDHGDSDAPNNGKVIMLSEQSPGPITFPKIDRKPKPGRWGRGEMKSLPKYDPDSDNSFQVDLRGYDLSKLDLRNSIENLMYADFDDRTVWPASDKMPSDFNWQKFMELGKNPGLGVRTLHERGITGKGVGVAIIDQPLLTEHQEYADRLRLYEENNVKDTDTSRMHGAAVASIAVGKAVGVAPDADLYYIATWEFTRDDDRLDNFVFRAQSIRRLLEINRQLPANRKIRVISNSIGWSPSQDGYDEITAACEEAKAAGIFVVSCGLGVYGFDFGGLGRHPLAIPDLFESYEPSLHWAKIFYDSTPGRYFDALWVPMDSRTTASFTGSDEYVFYRQGGASWCAPYIAGVYALAAQVEPEITPERFWKLALKTGRTIELEHKGERRSFGPIIDPVRLIRSIKAGELSNKEIFD